MRKTRTVQPSVFLPPEVVHPVAGELERASAWPWRARSTPRTARHDRRLACRAAPRRGSALRGRDLRRRILRCAVLMHLMGYSLSRGWSSRCSIPPPRQRFARVMIRSAFVPKKSAVARAPSARSTPTRGKRSTTCCCRTPSSGGSNRGRRCVHRQLAVTETDILEPSDSRHVVRRGCIADAAAAGGARAELPHERVGASVPCADAIGAHVASDQRRAAANRGIDSTGPRRCCTTGCGC